MLCRGLLGGLGLGVVVCVCVRVCVCVCVCVLSVLFECCVCVCACACACAGPCGMSMCVWGEAARAALGGRCRKSSEPEDVVQGVLNPLPQRASQPAAGDASGEPPAIAEGVHSAPSRPNRPAPALQAIPEGQTRLYRILGPGVSTGPRGRRGCSGGGSPQSRGSGAQPHEARRRRRFFRAFLTDFHEVLLLFWDQLKPKNGYKYSHNSC